jgi:lipooligosaccharide transport system permease protein
MNGAVFETTFNVFVKLRFAKLYDAVITTPLEPEDVAAGELLWAVTRSVIYGTAFLIVMGVLGYVHEWAVIFAPLAAALIGLSFGLIGLVFTALTPTIDLFSYFFTLFITPLFLFSGIFFPVSRLGSAAFIAWFSPLYHGAELMRGLILTGDLGWAAAHALWLVLFSVLVIPPAINLMRRRLVT